MAASGTAQISSNTVKGPGQRSRHVCSPGAWRVLADSRPQCPPLVLGHTSGKPCKGVAGPPWAARASDAAGDLSGAAAAQLVRLLPQPLMRARPQSVNCNSSVTAAHLLSRRVRAKCPAQSPAWLVSACRPAPAAGTPQRAAAEPQEATMARLFDLGLSNVDLWRSEEMQLVQVSSGPS